MSPTPCSSNAKQKGLSLVELMVAMLVSMVLLLGIVELFMSTLRTDLTSTELARTQESGRIAMELLSREVRRAGYQGCIGATISTTVGSISYPDEAIQAPTTTSFTVNYARSNGTSNGNFPHRDCNNQGMDSYQVTFSNCGTNLCITSTDSGGQQTLTNNTQITDIQYGVLQSNNRTVWKDSDTVTADDEWSDVRKVQLTLAVSSANDDEFQDRTFTSVIDLRNRL